MVISSHIEGRLRVRDARLRDNRFREMLQAKLESLDGVNEVSGNARAGSLLILYRQAQLPLEKLNQLLGSLLGRQPDKLPPMRPKPKAAPAVPKMRLPNLPDLPKLSLAVNRRQAVNWGMLLSLLVSLAGLAVDSKRLHIIAGTVFVGIFGIHLLDKRKALVA
ncbi:MAG: hypothetical protein GWO11_05265 [Desulfuromonadales bacterium]|nr:hypothetical protein [Desulfuromonadales bacterium]NIR33804.1 hypothetical protein [Desulfuromonadales bacterium]NIS42507.1 hypothetical protein [Desulfuromonadales bacterium]